MSSADEETAVEKEMAKEMQKSKGKRGRISNAILLDLYKKSAAQMAIMTDIMKSMQVQLTALQQTQPQSVVSGNAMQNTQTANTLQQVNATDNALSSNLDLPELKVLELEKPKSDVAKSDEPKPQIGLAAAKAEKLLTAERKEWARRNIVICRLGKQIFYKELQTDFAHPNKFDLLPVEEHSSDLSDCEFTDCEIMESHKHSTRNVNRKRIKHVRPKSTNTSQEPINVSQVPTGEGIKLIQAYKAKELNKSEIDLDSEIDQLRQLGEREKMKRMPHQKVDFPRFRGSKDRNSPLMFWSDLLRYQTTFGLTDREMLREVMPYCFIHEAKSWYTLKRPVLNNMLEFKNEFFATFVPTSMLTELNRILMTANQRDDESLPQFILAMSELFNLTNSKLTEVEKVNHVLDALHPEYAVYFSVENPPTDLNKLYDLSLKVTHKVFKTKNYKPSKKSEFSLLHYLQEGFKPDESGSDSDISVQPRLKSESYDLSKVNTKKKSKTKQQKVQFRSRSPSQSSQASISSVSSTKSNDSDKSKKPKQTDMNKVKCHNCNMYGHMRKSCPQKAIDKEKIPQKGIVKESSKTQGN